MNRALLFWLAILLTFAGCFGLWFGVRGMLEPAATEENSAAGVSALTGSEPEMTEFTLTDQVGREFDSRDLAGKVWAGSFFFTRCPQICVQQNNQVAKLQQEFAGRGLELVSITVDPEFDQPHKLAAYAQRFNADPQHWHFLTGDLDYIQRIGREYFQVMVEEETHTDRVLVFDRQGKMQGAFRATVPDQFQDLLELLDELLAAEQRPPDSEPASEPAGDEKSLP
jgi:protein SCO1/2